MPDKTGKGESRTGLRSRRECRARFRALVPASRGALWARSAEYNTVLPALW